MNKIIAHQTLQFGEEEMHNLEITWLAARPGLKHRGTGWEEEGLRKISSPFLKLL